MFKKLLIWGLILFFPMTVFAYEPNAKQIKTDTTNFDKNLSSSDTDVQKTLETIDELSLGGAPAGNTGQVQYNNGGVFGGGFMYYPTGNKIQPDTVEFKDANTYITKDNNNNLTFTDNVSGTKTLAQLLDPESDNYYWDGVSSWEPQGQMLLESTFNAKVGEVQASPTANTILARLKDLLTGIVLAAGDHVIGAVTQSGTWTISSITNAVAVTGTFWQTKQPISISQTTTDNDVDVANFPSEYPLPAAQVSTLTPPAAITGFATQTTLAALNAKLASGTVIGDVNLGATDNAVLDAIAAKDFATQTTLAAINTALQTGGISQTQFASMVTALQVIDNFISGSKGLVTEDNSASIKTAVEAVNTALQTSGISQVQFAAMVTALQLIDNAVDGNYFNTNMNIAGTDVAAGAGAVTAQTQRVTVANDSTGAIGLNAGINSIGAASVNPLVWISSASTDVDNSSTQVFDCSTADSTTKYISITNAGDGDLFVRVGGSAPVADGASAYYDFKLAKGETRWLAAGYKASSTLNDVYVIRAAAQTNDNVIVSLWGFGS